MKETIGNGVVIIIALLIPLGYILNIVKLIDCDFKPPKYEEKVRIVGILFPPVGIIAGYVNIKDN